MTALLEGARLRNETPQSMPADPAQVENNAGGYTFVLSDRTRIERFLILGTDGGTYYVNERKLTKDNLDFMFQMVAANEELVAELTVDVSTNGRAYKNSPALFAVALLLTEGKDKARARWAFDQVVRTSTHLFEVASYVDELGGWGRSKRKAFASWYETKEADALAYQGVKYRQRNGWTHRDILRLSHATPDSSVAKFMLGKPTHGAPAIIAGFHKMQTAVDAKEVIYILGKHQHPNLPWETIPTALLKDAEVWKTLFYNGQLQGQALIRNVTRLARLEAFRDLSFAADYAARLTDETMIAKTRLHPINYLNAAVIYQNGAIDRKASLFNNPRKRDWSPESVIIDALDEGFNKAFKFVTPANKRTMVALDVSGSMVAPALGLDLSCVQVSAAMGMTIARTEPAHMIKGFAGGLTGAFRYDRNAELVDLNISARTNLAGAMKEMSGQTFGSTDCALPMVWAKNNNVEIDTFVIITDNETWYGDIHPHQALAQYRQHSGINARLAVLGVASTGFTIADPADKGQMDFAGFDANTPRVLADFSAGRI